MASLKNIIYFVAMCTLVVAVSSQSSQGGPHISQGGPHSSQGAHENQGRLRRQVPQNVGEEKAAQDHPSLTTCDFSPGSVLSCADCHTRLICKPIGGLLKPCDNPARPHCNNGICMSMPAAGC